MRENFKMESFNLEFYVDLNLGGSVIEDKEVGSFQGSYMGRIGFRVSFGVVMGIGQVVRFRWVLLFYL